MLPAIENGCSHVVENSEPEKGADNLKGAGNTEAGNLVGFAAGNLSSFIDDLSGVSRIKTGYHVKERGLAGSVRTDQAHDLPLTHEEVQVRKGAQSTESPADPNTLKHKQNPVYRFSRTSAPLAYCITPSGMKMITTTRSNP